MEHRGTAPFTLRVATGADEAAVTGLLQACYPVLMPAGYDPATLAAALPIITRANPRLLASGTFYLAEAADGSAVGCGGWSLERPDEDSRQDRLGHIRHFATHPRWIGRGVGRALYDCCQRDARAAGVDRFECYASLNAERFYASLGFQRQGPMMVTLPGGVGFPAIRMNRAI